MKPRPAPNIGDELRIDISLEAIKQ